MDAQEKSQEKILSLMQKMLYYSRAEVFFQQLTIV